MLVDVHCHLVYGPLKDMLDEVIERIEKNNVIVISCGTELKSNRETLELLKKSKNIRVALGFYPVHCEEVSKREFDKEIEFIRANKDKIVAISEVGLDYKEGKDKELQKECFQKIIDLSKEIQKPLIVHSRNAELDAIEMLENSKIKDVVMHCFMGKKSLVKRIIKNNWYFSIPALVIKLEHFQNVVKLTDNLLTETDAPFLSPVKGKPNEPAFVIEAIKKIAEVKNISLKQTEDLIYKNYQKLFK